MSGNALISGSVFPIAKSAENLCRHSPSTHKTREAHHPRFSALWASKSALQTKNIEHIKNMKRTIENDPLESMSSGGWIDPYGELHPARHFGHEGFALKVLSKEYGVEESDSPISDLCERGWVWVRVTPSTVHYDRGGNCALTRKQAAQLQDLADWWRLELDVFKLDRGLFSISE